uniref:RRM domain-containing protein n=1 Tax=Parascaris univalens TaxID=6257 RepID=A0A914ZZ54_PARUN
SFRWVQFSSTRASSRTMGSRRDCRIFIGNLPQDVTQRDLEDIFEKYGHICYTDIKFTRGVPFAFIEFDDPRDARDAVRGRDGYSFDGCRLRVELTRGVGPRGPGGRPLYAAEQMSPRRRAPPPRRSGYRVVISGLPASGSWQDLKDHMREAGDICYADISKDGTGVVEYISYDDMKYAVRRLDGTKFKSHEGEASYIRVREASSRSRSRSRHRSVSRSHSRSRSPRVSRDSPRYNATRSASRSRSMSASPKLNRRILY